MWFAVIFVFHFGFHFVSVLNHYMANHNPYYFVVIIIKIPLASPQTVHTPDDQANVLETVKY